MKGTRGSEVGTNEMKEARNGSDASRKNVTKSSRSEGNTEVWRSVKGRHEVLTSRRECRGLAQNERRHEVLTSRMECTGLAHNERRHEIVTSRRECTGLAHNERRHDVLK